MIKKTWNSIQHTLKTYFKGELPVVAPPIVNLNTANAPVMKDLFEDVHFIYSICMDKQGKLDFYCDCPTQSKQAGRLIAHFIYVLTKGGMTQQMLSSLYDNPDFSESFIEFVIKNVSGLMEVEDRPVVAPSEFMRRNGEGE